MARIPVYQERQQVGQLRPIGELNAPSAGAEAIGGAVRQVGQALGQMGVSSNTIVRRNAETWATNKATDELVYWTNRTEQLKAEAGPGGANYVRTLNDEFGKRANQLIAEAPDDQSRRFLQQNFFKLRQNLLTDGIQFEVVEGRAAEIASFGEAANKIALVAAKTQNPALIQAEIGQMEARIDASTLLPRQKLEQKQQMRERISLSYASAVVQNNPGAAVAILSKAPPVVTGNANRESLYNGMQYVESANNPKAVSPKGAVGLMQVMPETAMDPGFGLPNIFEFAKSKGATIGARNYIEAARLLSDPEIGQEYGRKYMDAMLDQFDGNVVYALAAYNMGPGAAAEWVAMGADMNRLPKETRDYIPKVLNASGLTGTVAGEPQDSLFGMLPLGEQLKLLEVARQNESTQYVESFTQALWTTLGPQSDTDAIELDVLNANIDVQMADRTAEERRLAKQMMADYAQAFNASAQQRDAVRKSGIWQQVINGQPLSAIQGSEEWKALDGTTKAKLIGEISTFNSKPTSPDQWAMYYDITADKQRFAAMTQEEVLVAAGGLGRELGIQLVKDRAALNSPADIGKAEIDKNTFNRLATEAGLKPFTARTEDEKRQLGELQYAFEREIQAQQNILKRPLNREETEEAMYNVINNKVFVDRTFGDKELPIALVERDDMDETYVRVGDRVVYLKTIPAESRTKIIRQLRLAGEPVTEAAIAEVYIAAQQTKDPRFGQIPQ